MATKFLDLHAHYPMHLGLPSVTGEDPVSKSVKNVLFAVANEIDNFRPINQPRVTAPKIRASAAMGLASVLYDPEDEFFVGQKPRPVAIKHIQKQIENVEADARAHGLAIAKTGVDVARSIAKAQPFLVHCMEGGHGLSGDPSNVRTLEQLGVVYIILAHLRFLGLAGCAKGLPCKTNFSQKLINPSRDPAVGLTDTGFQILEAILSSRILLDVTHCSDLSRADIMKFYSSGKYQRPVISSHTGVRYLANYELNVTDEWIKFIADTGGAIGVILFPFWLANDPKGKDGIRLVGDTIDHIYEVGGSDCVAIGTDFDGFIQPIRECRDYTEIPDLVAALEKRYEKTPEFAEKLLFRNALRVINEALP